MSVYTYLVEKSWEHKEKMFINFLNQRSVYYYILRQELCRTLRKLEVLDTLVNWIESFHRQRIRLKEKLTDPIDVRNGQH